MPAFTSSGNVSGSSHIFSINTARTPLTASPSGSATKATSGGFVVLKFTSSGTLVVGGGIPGLVDVLLVGGGSPGTGSSNLSAGAAGGSGGKTRTLPYLITQGNPIPIVVGGASTNSSLGPETSNPGSAASGGAAGSPGAAGFSNNYETGSNLTYGGGGGGGSPGPVPAGLGGAGGGGNGGGGGASGLPGTANLGGGGGGGGHATTDANPLNPLTFPTSGGVGGTGVVIVRAPSARFT
jgi:hypothetical protein